MGRSQTARPCGPQLWSQKHALSRLHRVLAALSLKPLRALLSPSSGYVTHALLTLPPLTGILLLRSVRLACLSHAASVRSEPGSNSSRKIGQQPWLSCRHSDFDPNSALRTRNPAAERVHTPCVRPAGSIRPDHPFPQGGRAVTLTRLRPLFTCKVARGRPSTRPTCLWQAGHAS